MKIKILDIPEEGLDLQVPIEGTKKQKGEDRWFLEVLQEVFKDDYPKGRKASLNLRIQRTCNNVSLAGTIDIDLLSACDRCAELYENPVSVPLRLDLVPYRGGMDERLLDEREEEESELAEEDVNFAFYKGSELDLADVVREMMLIEIPIRYLCKEECKGLCPQCGKNLNQGPCRCQATPAKAPFAVLKDLMTKRR